MRRILVRFTWMVVGAVLSVPVLSLAQDWFEASGVPAQRAIVSSADIRNEFAAIETDIADKLPTLTGNGNKIIRVNAGGTALEAASTGIVVSEGGTGATTLTGLLQGNGTSAFTAITDSSTAGQVLRVTGASTYAWGALDLADGDAITGDLPDANLTSNVPLLNQVNTFSANQVLSAAGSPEIRVTDTTNSVLAMVQALDTAAHIGTESNHDLLIRTADTTRITVENDGAEIQFDATAVDLNGTLDVSSYLYVLGGNATAPGVSFTADPDTGIHRAADNAVGIGGNGTLVGYFSTSEVDLNAAALDFNGALDLDGSSHVLTGATSGISIDAVSAGVIAAFSASEFRLLDGAEFRIYDSSDTDYVQFAHDGTDLNVTTVTTSDINIDGEPITPSTGTFTIDYDTGCSTTPTGSYSYTKIGNIVVLQLEGDISCTGDNIGMTSTTDNLPAAITPADNQCLVFGGVTNAGSGANPGIITLESDGDIHYSPPGNNACGGANWTASGSRTVREHTVTYHLN